MPFMTLDGFTVPLSVATVQRRISKMGKRQRSFRGQMRSTDRGERRQFDGTACFINISHRQQDAEAFFHMVEGEGHHCFLTDGLTCSTGLNPLPGYGRVFLNPAGATPFAGVTGRATTVGSGLVAKWDAQVQDDMWTFGMWEDDGGWILKSRLGDGRAYLGATPNATTLTPSDEFSVDVTDGVFALTREDSPAASFSNLFMLPYLASEQQIAGLASLAIPPGPKPVMRLASDLIGEDWIYVVGQVTGRDYVNKPTNVNGFGWISNAELVRFSLFEVTSAFVYDDQIPGWDGKLRAQGST